MLIGETRPYVSYRTLACFAYQNNQETKPNSTETLLVNSQLKDSYRTSKKVLNQTKLAEKNL